MCGGEAIVGDGGGVGQVGRWGGPVDTSPDDIFFVLFRYGAFLRRISTRGLFFFDPGPRLFRRPPPAPDPSVPDRAGACTRAERGGRGGSGDERGGGGGEGDGCVPDMYISLDPM